MEFMNRGTRQPQSVNPPEGESQPHVARVNRAVDSRIGPRGLRIAQVGLLAGVTILIVAAAILLATSNNDNKNTSTVVASNEARLVDTGKMQAVFLNNGQVYFGKIGDLNKDYLTMSDIYYLRVNQQVQPGQQANQNDVTLAKLGCELHGPEDRMVLNRSQIVFWENLKTDGQVADAVAKDKDAKKSNPELAKCPKTQTNNNTNSANTNRNP